MGQDNMMLNKANLNKNIPDAYEDSGWVADNTQRHFFTTYYRKVKLAEGSDVSWTINYLEEIRDCPGNTPIEWDKDKSKKGFVMLTTVYDSSG